MSEPILRLRGIRHSYDSVVALDGVDFDLFPGEVHAVAGDHRSGKSTLIRLVSGDLRKQFGTIQFLGRELPYFTHESAMREKIGIISQNPRNFMNMSAVENIFAGRIPRSFISRRQYRQMEDTCRVLLTSLELDIDIHRPIGKYSFKEQQLIGIARALHIGQRIIIVDEISQRLTPFELEHIFGLIKNARAEGKAIIYATSNIDEIFKIADRVTVLKNGHRRGTEKVDKVERSRLINLAFSFAMDEEGEKETRHKLLLLSQYDEAVMNDLPIGMLLIGKDWNVFFANSAAGKIFGMPRNEIIGRQIGAFLESRNIAGRAELLQALESGSQYSNPAVQIGEGKILKLSTYPLVDRERFSLGTTILLEDSRSITLPANT